MITGTVLVGPRCSAQWSATLKEKPRKSHIEINVFGNWRNFFLFEVETVSVCFFFFSFYAGLKAGLVSLLLLDPYILCGCKECSGLCCCSFGAQKGNGGGGLITVRSWLEEKRTTVAEKGRTFGLKD